MKKNWYGKKNARFMLLYSDGTILKYKDEAMTKGKTRLSASVGCNVRKTGRKEMSFYCAFHKKTMVIV